MKPIFVELAGQYVSYSINVNQIVYYHQDTAPDRCKILFTDHSHLTIFQSKEDIKNSIRKAIEAA